MHTASQWARTNSYLHSFVELFFFICLERNETHGLVMLCLFSSYIISPKRFMWFIYLFPRGWLQMDLKNGMIAPVPVNYSHECGQCIWSLTTEKNPHQSTSHEQYSTRYNTVLFFSLCLVVFWCMTSSRYGIKCRLLSVVIIIVVTLLVDEFTWILSRIVQLSKFHSIRNS